MHDPLAQNEQGADRQAHSIQIGLSGDEAHLQPCWWVKSHRFVQYPIEIGKFCKVIKGWRATGKHRADLVLQFDTYLRVLGEQVKRPDEGNGGRFVTCREEGQDVIVNLFIGQFRTRLFPTLCRHKHGKNVTVIAVIVTALSNQCIDQHI